MPLLDRLFVVSDSGSGGGIGMGVILIVELLMRTHHRLFLIQHVGSRVEFSMYIGRVILFFGGMVLDPPATTFFFAEVGKITYYSNI
jgi:hypothetical protein